MNSGSLTSASTLSTTVIFVPARWLPRSSVKPPGACYLLLLALQGGGMESRVFEASVCALCTPRPRGDLERLLTTLKRSADRPQTGMGKAKMRLLQPLPGLSKGLAQHRASAAKVLTRTRRRLPTGREIGRGILAEVTRRHPQYGSALEVRRGASHNGP